MRATVAPALTLSAGLGTIVPSVAGNPRQFVEAMDWLLRSIKENGRNRAQFSLED